MHLDKLTMIQWYKTDENRGEETYETEKAQSLKGACSGREVQPHMCHGTIGGAHYILAGWLRDRASKFRTVTFRRGKEDKLLHFQFYGENSGSHIFWVSCQSLKKKKKSWCFTSQFIAISKNPAKMTYSEKLRNQIFAFSMCNYMCILSKYLKNS